MLMRRRLYFLLPDVEIARNLLNEMLLARIQIEHIHFLGRRGELPEDLPEANVLQKTDMVHGAQVGLGVGGVAGAVLGLLLVWFPPEGLNLQMVTVLITTLLGALFGVWVSSMAASSVPNSRLKRFQEDIDNGRILMMVDVPMLQATEILARVTRLHPEVVSGGYEPTTPAFP